MGEISDQSKKQDPEIFTLRGKVWCVLLIAAFLCSNGACKYHSWYAEFHIQTKEQK